MRVFHRNHDKLTAKLQSDGITLYAPMHTTWKEKDGHKHKETKPIGNLLFLHTTIEFVKNLRREHDILVYRKADSPEPAEVPEHEIEMLRRVVDLTGGEVEYFEKTDLLAKSGKRVEITDGPLRGMTGILRYVRKKKRVVVTLEGICSIVILQHIPPHAIRVINETD